MKPILHGLTHLHGVTVETKILTEKINLEGLIRTLEHNQDKALPEDWLVNYQQIAPIYKTIYTEGEIPEEDLEGIDTVILEMASECVDEDVEDILFNAELTSGRNYHYEFCRSIGVEEMASRLTEYIDDECDFI